MSAEVKKEIALEIAHVLFIDIVGYSKLSINDQNAAVSELNQIVRASEQFQRAESAGRLLKIATGDGMALVFYTSPESPAQGAVEISRALKEHPHLQLRMGIHSGPVSGVVDVNDRPNLAGAGLNIAQRVMDCGDAGHILLSKHVAEDLAEYDRWRPVLHDIGTCEVKHGVRVSVTNLHFDGVGNPQLPWKLRASKNRRARMRWVATAGALLAIGVVIALVLLIARRPLRTSLAVAEKTIAVLPFENLSRDAENAIFADGVQDEILTNLARIADLKVISRTSVMQYKTGMQRNLREIGRQLGVAHVVEGSVQRGGNRVRVSAQLIDARSDTHLWAERYDRPLDDVFAIQSELAEKIAAQLRAKLSPSEKTAIERPPTTDLVAFDLYTRAKKLQYTTSFSAAGKDNLLKAVELFDRAIERDPDFFLAYCQLTLAHADLYLETDDHSESRRRLAEAAVSHALHLRPEDGEAHLARAIYLYNCHLDYAGARGELEIAKRTLPNSSSVFEWSAYIDRREGHWEDSARNFERALELDPRNFFILQQMSMSYMNLQRYPDVANVLDRALSVVPGDLETRVARAAADLDGWANPAPLHEAIQFILSEHPDDIGSVASFWFYLSLCERDPVQGRRALEVIPENGISNDGVIFPRSWCEGFAARIAGDDTAAREAFSRARVEVEGMVRNQPDYAPPLSVLGMIDAMLGDKEQSISNGRRAVEMLPVVKDSIVGAHMIKNLAFIYAHVGDKSLAIDQLVAALQARSDVSYGQLCLHPYWDPLRGDPRFEKIVNSLAPKESIRLSTTP